MRQRLFHRLLRLTGYAPGMIPRWHHKVLHVLFFPCQIVRYIAAGVFDYSGFCVTIQGIKFSLMEIDRIKRMPLPSEWFRLVEITDGRPVFEKQRIISWQSNFAMPILDGSKGKLTHTEANEIADNLMLHLWGVRKAT